MQKILIIDDETDIRELISDSLEDLGYSTVQGHSAKSALEMFAAEKPDIVILDIWLEGSDFDGIGVLKRIKEHDKDVPVIMISGHGNIETAIETIKLGAYDFIEKPFQEEKLHITVNRASHFVSLLKENEHLKDINKISNELIGSSKFITQLKEKITSISSSDTRVMIFGESGSGKETIARQIHNKSKRAKHPFYAFCCSTITDSSFDDIFYGFADKKNYKFGIFEKAASGTLYLDEIADIPLTSQAKLLKTVQDQYFIKPGSGNKVSIDVRIVSSSSKDIGALIEKDKFNKSLFYRLNVFPIQMTPLRERREDIKELCANIITTLDSKIKISEQAMSLMEIYEWPGNIRQLRNILEWMSIMYSDKKTVEVENLPNELKNLVSNDNADGDFDLANIATLNLKNARDEFEKIYLKIQLERFNGNISKTADSIGMDRTALHRKIKALKIA